MKSRKNTALKTIHKYIGVRGGGGTAAHPSLTKNIN